MDPSPENPSPADTPAAVARIDFELACVHCAKPLEGAPLDGNCPTCSKPIADTLDPDLIDLPTATVSADIPCPQCGYNLRTLRIDGLCPECGQPFVLALSRRPLSATDPVWRKRVLSGINRLLFFIIATPLSAIAMIIAMVLVPGTYEPVALVAIVAIEATLFVALATGIFYVSSRDRRATDPHESAWPRIVARTAIILAGISFVWVHVPILASMTFLPRVVQGASREIALLLLVAMGLIIPIAVGFCFRHIARRAQHESLMKSTRLWLLLFSICATATVLSPGIAFLVSKLLPNSNGVLVAGAVLLAIVVIVDLILYFTALFGLAEFRNLFRSADVPENPRGPQT